MFTVVVPHLEARQCYGLFFRRYPQERNRTSSNRSRSFPRELDWNEKKSETDSFSGGFFGIDTEFCYRKWDWDQDFVFSWATAEASGAAAAAAAAAAVPLERWLATLELLAVEATLRSLRPVLFRDDEGSAVERGKSVMSSRILGMLGRMILTMFGSIWRTVGNSSRYVSRAARASSSTATICRIRARMLAQCSRI